MARVYVDQSVAEQIDEWYYTNSDGNDEGVQLASSKKTVSLIDSDCEEIMVYVSDIPNMIKALEAAYNTAKGN